MKTLKTLSIIPLAIALLATSACSFTPETEATKRVLLVKQHNIHGCNKIGTTLVQVPYAISGIALPDSQIQKELIAIAKQDAAVIQGDSIVALSPVKGGFQTFGIFHCK